MCNTAYDASSRVQFKFEEYNMIWSPMSQMLPEPNANLTHLAQYPQLQQLQQEQVQQQELHKHGKPRRQFSRLFSHHRRLRPHKSPEGLLAHSQVCCVCGDPATGFHYSALTCEACKSFFKRTVQDKHTYTCFGNFDCSVNKSLRKACQHCRFQKCIKSGMQPLEVRMDHTRGGRRKCKRTSREQFDELVDKIAGESADAAVAAVAKLAAPAAVGQDRLLRDFVRDVESAHVFCCAPAELPMPDWLAADVKTPAAFRLAVRHWFRRGLAGVVRWALSLACLEALPRSDLCELLHENWLAVLALDTLAWSRPFDGTIRFGSNFCLRREDLEAYRPLEDFYCTLQSMFWSLDAVQLSNGELAVLKLVTLLDQSVADRLIDSEALAPLSGAAMRALYAVCAEKLGADAASGLVDDYAGKLVMRLGFTVNLRHGCRVWTSLDPPSCSEAHELIDTAMGLGPDAQQAQPGQQLRRQEGSSGSFCLSSSSSSASLLL